MNQYEVACVFRAEDEPYNRGRVAVKEVLQELGANFTNEEDMGARQLAYTVKKQDRGHYLVYYVNMAPEKAKKIEHALRLNSDLLKVMVIRN